MRKLSVGKNDIIWVSVDQEWYDGLDVKTLRYIHDYIKTHTGCKNVAVLPDWIKLDAVLKRGSTKKQTIYFLTDEEYAKLLIKNL